MPADQLELFVASRQTLGRGLRGCLGSGMREGGMFWVKRLGDTVRWEEVRLDGTDNADETGDEASRGSSTSSSPQQLLLLGMEGEQGGDPSCMPSPSEEERLLLAMELAVGFM